MIKLLDYLKNNKGETMLEMIISVAIFSLMISFAATAFAAANNIEADNYDVRNDMNSRLSLVANANAENPSGNVKVTEEKKVTFEIKRNNNINDSGEFYVKNVNDKVSGGFEKVGYASKASSTDNINKQKNDNKDNKDNNGSNNNKGN